MHFPPMRLAPLEATCAALPAAWMVVQWRGLHAWKVGPADDARAKMFAILSPEAHRGDGGATATLKVRPEREPFLRELPGVGTAPHLPRGGWLRFGLGCELEADDVAAHLAESHAIVAASLPVKLRPPGL